MLACKDDEIDGNTLSLLNAKSALLIEGKPVQYVTGTASFYGMDFKVDNNVLIPRQETEMLVDSLLNSLLAEHSRSGDLSVKILDIGTGSGCIAISLKKNLSGANIFAIDVSPKALYIARENAKFNEVDVSFAKYDILSEDNFPFKENFDIIVSNPPYVMNSEKLLMHKNVTDFEPSLALYVDDKDPLIFYRSILCFAERHQPERKPSIFFEINENLGKEMLELCKSFGYQAEIIKDLNGKDRFIKAQNS